MKMKILIISILVANSPVCAGLLKTVVEMPVKAVQATGTVVKDVVTAPEDIVKDTATIPAKTVGAIPIEEDKNEPSRPAEQADDEKNTDMDTLKEPAALPHDIDTDQAE